MEGKGWWIWSGVKESESEQVNQPTRERGARGACCWAAFHGGQDALTGLLLSSRSHSLCPCLRWVRWTCLLPWGGSWGAAHERLGGGRAVCDQEQQFLPWLCLLRKPYSTPQGTGRKGWGPMLIRAPYWTPEEVIDLGPQGNLSASSLAPVSTVTLAYLGRESRRKAEDVCVCMYTVCVWGCVSLLFPKDVTWVKPC